MQGVEGIFCILFPGRNSMADCADVEYTDSAGSEEIYSAVTKDGAHGKYYPYKGGTCRGKYTKTECDSVSIKRGDIYYADLSPVIGSEQGGLRPVLIVQNDVGNRYSPTVIAAAITSKVGKTKLPTHIDIHADRVGLSRDSVVLLEQIRTIDKKRLREKMGHLDEAMMGAVNDAIGISFGLLPPGADNQTR